MCMNSNSPLTISQLECPAFHRAEDSKLDHDLRGATRCHVTFLNNKKQHVNDSALSSIKEIKAK